MFGCCRLATSFRGVQSYSDIAWRPSRRHAIRPGAVLGNRLQFQPRSQIAGAGVTRVIFRWTAPKRRGGCCRHPCCLCGMKSRLDAERHHAGRVGHCLALGHLSGFTDGVQGRWSAENALIARCGGGCCPGTPPSFYKHNPDTMGRGNRLVRDFRVGRCSS
jgi:hypothetical protein